MQADVDRARSPSRVSRSMRATVPVAAMPRSSTTTRSAAGSVPVGSVGSPSFGQRPPQWLTQADRAVAADRRAERRHAAGLDPALDPARRPASTIASSFSNTSGTTARRRASGSRERPARRRGGGRDRQASAERHRAVGASRCAARSRTAPPARLPAARGGTVRPTSGDLAHGIERQPLQRRRAVQLPAAADARSSASRADRAAPCRRGSGRSAPRARLPIAPNATP